ncbi:MAG TPA: ABC transporter permease subunit [Stellaceae bacterium]|nr:ABC transporter permease subunit [Stellaceae bacterium]
MIAAFKTRPALARWAVVLTVLVLWEAIDRLAALSPIIVAPPSAVFLQIIRTLFGDQTVPGFYLNAAITVGEVVAAYLIAMVVGVLLGLIFASSKVVGDAFEPILLVLYAVPKIILFPLLILILGIGVLPNVAFGVLLGVFVVIFNTSAGLRQIEPNYLRLARSLGYGRRAIFFKVVLPAAAPTIVAGLRLGFGYTIIGVITAELLVVSAGLGSLIDYATVNYLTAPLYALVLITLAIGIAGNSLFSVVERRWIK